MSQGNHAYMDHVRRLEQRLGSGNEALRLAVGGESEAVGKLEYYLLRSLGLTTGPLVVDVGCGSGRLAQQLARIKASATATKVISRFPKRFGGKMGPP
jgi:2-polyprenyl-3-methyl-5-hydroxy-6-metoxy-1,4-benzoquinol methylase